MCKTGKRAFRRRKTAKHWLKKWKRCKGFTGLKTVYRCPQCGWYHVTRNCRSLAETVKLKKNGDTK